MPQEHISSHNGSVNLSIVNFSTNPIYQKDNNHDNNKNNDLDHDNNENNDQDNESNDDQDNESNDEKDNNHSFDPCKDNPCTKKGCIYWCTLISMIGIELGGIWLTGTSAIVQHAQYDKIQSIDYVISQTNTSYCSKYDSCFWSCCLDDNNRDMCPNNDVNQINDTSYNRCHLNTKSKDQKYSVGTECGNNSYFHCCYGGPCIEIVKYWSIYCLYELTNNDRTTYVKVSTDHLFPTKDIAKKSFSCKDETNDTKRFMPLYYPTKDFELKISLPSNISMCPYIPSQCAYTNEIVFDPLVVYGMNSKEYYNAYEYMRRINLIVGIFLLSSLCIIPTIWCWITNSCCFYYIFKKEST